MTAPTGHVTLLFTDIQGSTSLWESLPDTFAAILDKHNKIIRRNIERFSGYEVKTEGDAFMIAFSAPEFALRHAIATQLDLAMHRWPDESGEILVRMGLHSGNPICIPNPLTGRMDYFGPMVNRAARVAGLGAGGQIVLSESAYRLLDTSENVKILQAGVHSLKGLAVPEQVFLAIPAGLDHRPAFLQKNERKSTGNLPRNSGDFIGRSHELSALTGMLTTDGHSLVVVHGTAGVGKSRIAIEAANRVQTDFPNGAFYTDVGGCETIEHLCAAVCRALGHQITDQSDALSQVADLLAMRPRCLILLDNYERFASYNHAGLERWLQVAPEACFLVTSQISFTHNHQSLRISPLNAQGPTSAAVEYFIEKARNSGWNGKTDDKDRLLIGKIAEALDGIPLALELVSAKARVYGLEALFVSLSDRFQAARIGDGQSRQTSLRGAIDWSFSLLSDQEKNLLTQLCLFKGSFKPTQVRRAFGGSNFRQHQTIAEMVLALEEKNVIRRTLDGASERFELFRSLRDFIGTMPRTETIDMKNRNLYLKYYAQAASEFASQFNTDAAGEALKDAEHDLVNIEFAFELALKKRDSGSIYLFTCLLDEVYRHRGPGSQRVRHLYRAIRSFRDRSVMSLRLSVLLARSFLDQGQLARMTSITTFIVPLIAQTTVSGPEERHSLLLSVCWLAELLIVSGQYQDADSILSFASKELLAETASPEASGHYFLQKAALALRIEDPDCTRRYLDQFELAIDSGQYSPMLLASYFRMRSALASDRQNYDAACKSIETALEFYELAGSGYGMVQALNALGLSLYHLRRYDLAKARFETAGEMSHSLQNYRENAKAKSHLAMILHAEGKIHEAGQQFRTCAELVGKIGDHELTSQYLANEGICLVECKHWLEGIKSLKSSLQLRRSHGIENGPSWLLAYAKLAIALEALEERSEAKLWAEDGFLLAKKSIAALDGVNSATKDAISELVRIRENLRGTGS